jgi:C4-dicarboxylate transporter, DctM subunit
VVVGQFVAMTCACRARVREDGGRLQGIAKVTRRTSSPFWSKAGSIALLTRIVDAIGHFTDVIVVLAIGLDVLLVFGSAVGRYGPGWSMPWTADASAICLQALAFVGGAASYRHSGNSIAFRYVVERSSAAVQPVLDACGIWLVIAVAATSLEGFPRYFASSRAQEMAQLPANEGWMTIWLGLGLVLIVLFSIDKLAKLPTRANIIGAIFAIAGAAVLVGVRGMFGNGGLGLDPAIPAVFVMAIGFLLGISIAFVLAIGGLTFIWLTGAIPILSVPSTLGNGIASPLLAAIPFFMVAGVLMAATGMSRNLVGLMDRWLGHWRGGLLMSTVGAMYLFSGMSGSKTADIAAVGSVVRDPLRERGYPPGETVAVLAASAVMGETVPPSIAMLVLGSITTISIAALFSAGLIPAIVLGVAITVGIIVRARRRELPGAGTRFDLRAALKAVPASVPALLVPVIVVGSIIGGITTPTEGSSIAVIYGLLAAAFVYRALKPVVLWRLLRDAAVTSGMILLILATANLLTQAFVLDGLNQPVLAILTSTGTPLGFLILSCLGMIVLGSVLEGLPALILFAPVLVPEAIRLGINPIQFGILLIISLGIGVFAPPIGVGLYIASAIGGTSIAQAIRPSLFYNGLLLAGLALLILFPGITLLLPHLFGFK